MLIGPGGFINISALASQNDFADVNITAEMIAQITTPCGPESSPDGNKYDEMYSLDDTGAMTKLSVAGWEDPPYMNHGSVNYHIYCCESLFICTYKTK